MAKWTPGKKVPWGWTRLNNFEVCGEKYKQVDLLKNFTDTSDMMDWGRRVHDALAARLQSKRPFDPDLVETLEHRAATIERWASKYKATVLVEHKYALTRDLRPHPWMGPLVWVRAIGDVVLLFPPAAIVVDWKTGKPVDDSAQLPLLAQCVFSNHPAVQKVACLYGWTNPEFMPWTTFEYRREDMGAWWERVLPRVSAYEQAHELGAFVPRPSKGRCGWCPVQGCAARMADYRK
jgi:hypothetical protein